MKKDGIIYVWKKSWEVHPLFWLEFMIVQLVGFFIGIAVGAIIQKLSC